MICSPRDSITISRTHKSTNTLVDISTSLPRMQSNPKDEPAFMRPAPPYVRSNVRRAFSFSLLFSHVDVDFGDSTCVVYTIHPFQPSTSPSRPLFVTQPQPPLGFLTFSTNARDAVGQ